MEQLKHECGVAMIRLLQPLEYYEKKYGTWMYGLNNLQKIRDGEPLGGKSRAEDDFATDDEDDFLN